MDIVVKDAAQRLGVSEARVRQLLAAGRIQGHQRGREWLVSSDDVARLQSNHSPHAGRPFSPVRAWAVLDLLDGGQAPWLSYSARSQLRAYLAAFDGDDIHRWRRILSARSELVFAYAHPGAIARLWNLAPASSNPGSAALPAGAAEAARRNFDLVALDDEAVPEIYIAGAAWEDFRRAFAVREPSSPSAANLRVRIPLGVWPFDRGFVSDSALAADLLESAEPRAVRAGQLRLVELLQAWQESRR